jgi:hypothetical protein
MEFLYFLHTLLLILKEVIYCMKKFLAVGIMLFALSLLTAGTAAAAPFKAAGKNPNIVAAYVSDETTTHKHTLPTDPLMYEMPGDDLVMVRGKSGNIQQWYEGEEFNLHSVWNISKDGTCPPNWVLIEEPYPVWGNHLVEGEDYCVHNNYYGGPK